MDIAVVGSPAFTLGFRPCWTVQFHNPDSDDELHSTLRSLLNNKSVGIMVVDSAVMATLPDRLKDQLSASVSQPCSASVRRKTPPCETPFVRP